MEDKGSITYDIFGVFKRKQTYLNILYLFLSFPLGIMYFVFLVTGLSLGVGLTPILIGIPVIYVVFSTSKSLMAFERKVAGALLNISFRDVQPLIRERPGFFAKMKDEIFDLDSWKAIFYLGSKFFTGILVFVLCVTLITMSIAFILAPIAVELLQSTMIINGNIEYNGIADLIGLNLTPFEESVIIMLIGLVLLYCSLHFFNLLAYINGKALEFMSPIGSKLN